MNQGQGEPNLIHEGLLRKSPPKAKIEKNYKWRKRHFKLWSNQMLEYYKTEQDKIPLREPLALASCTAITKNNEEVSKYLLTTKYKYPFCLQMPHRSYYLAASSETDRQIWIQKLQEVCTNVSPSLGNAVGMENRHESIASKISRRSVTTSSSSRTSVKSSIGDDDMHRTRLYSSASMDTDESSFATRGIENYDVVPSRPNENYDVPRKSTMESQASFDIRLTGRPTALSFDSSTSPRSLNSPTVKEPRISTSESMNSSLYDQVPAPRPLSPSDTSYDTPPSNRRLDGMDTYQDMTPPMSDTHVRIDYTLDRPIINRNPHSIKQHRTIVNKVSKEGYEQMEAQASNDDYIPIMTDGSNSPTPKEERRYRQPGRQYTLKSKSSTMPPIAPHVINGSFHTLPHSMSNLPSMNDEEPFHLIPKMETNSREEEKRPPALEAAGPLINRENKPKLSPTIDRSKKPAVIKQKTYVEKIKSFQTNKSATFDSTHSHYAHNTRTARSIETDYIQHNIKPVNNNTLPHNFNPNNNNNNNNMSHHQYENEPSIEHNNEAYATDSFTRTNGYGEDDEVYCNLDEKTGAIYTNNNRLNFNADTANNILKRHSNDVPSRRLFIETQKSIDYKTAALPEVPPMSLDDNTDPYENVQARHSSESQITYVEVCALSYSDSVFSETVDHNNDDGDDDDDDDEDDEEFDADDDEEEDQHMEVGESRDGSHYVFVDPIRTEALQRLQKR